MLVLPKLCNILLAESKTKALTLLILIYRGSSV